MPETWGNIKDLAWTDSLAELTVNKTRSNTLDDPMQDPNARSQLEKLCMTNLTKIIFAHLNTKTI